MFFGFIGGLIVGVLLTICGLVLVGRRLARRRRRKSATTTSVATAKESAVAVLGTAGGKKRVYSAN